MTHRTQKIASVVREVVSDAIANRLSDPRISALTSVTRVEISADLLQASVSVSVMGTPGAQRTTMAGLAQAAGRVQALVARRLTTRHCPRIVFRLDESIRKGNETLRMIEEAMAELEDAPAGDLAPTDAGEGDPDPMTEISS